MIIIMEDKAQQPISNELFYSTQKFVSDNFAEIRTDFKDFKLDLKESLNRIEKQTVKTNGSVADAVKEIDALKFWKGVFIGGIGVLSVLVVPIFIWMAQQILTPKIVVENPKSTIIKP